VPVIALRWWGAWKGLGERSGEGALPPQQKKIFINFYAVSPPHKKIMSPK